MPVFPRPAFDPELGSLLAQLPLVPVITDEMLTQLRALPSETIAATVGGRSIQCRDLVIEGDGGLIPLTIVTPADTPAGAPCVYWMHGGGRIMGDRFSQIDIPLEWLAATGAVVVSVDYRLAPEAGGRSAVDDGYRGLCWVAEHADELGIDPGRIVVAGTSAGGGLAAGVTQLARDLGGPTILAQILGSPMLDHRNATVSSRQYSGDPGIWTAETNAYAWRAVIGDRSDDEISPYVSPSRSADLSGLPPTYLDVGSAEVFRDEGVDYVSRIWAAGGEAELHVWSGGCHGFDSLFPQSELAVACRRVRGEWLSKVLARTESQL